MNTLTFTQYMRPSGRPIRVEFPCPNEIVEMGEALIAAGFSLEAEVLMSGLCSFEVLEPQEEILLANALVPNGPGVPAAVEEMIRKAHARLLRAEVPQ